MQNQNTEFFEALPERQLVFTQCLRSGEQLLGDLRLSGAHCVVAHFITVGQTFGTDDFDVGDAEETQNQLQIFFVGDAARLTGMDATGGG